MSISTAEYKKVFTGTGNVQIVRLTDSGPKTVATIHGSRLEEEGVCSQIADGVIGVYQSVFGNKADTSVGETSESESANSYSVGHADVNVTVMAQHLADNQEEPAENVDGAENEGTDNQDENSDNVDDSVDPNDEEA